MRTAYLDCYSGISGDMSLASLIDAGASVQLVQQVVHSMGLSDVSVTIASTTKKGFRGGQLSIEHPRESVHRNLTDILTLIRRATMSRRAKELSQRMFERLARVEASVHGTTIDRVHFHEVGAIDSIVDIVGVAVAWDELGIERAVASPVPTGTGSVRIAHGLVSIPAPATAELLRNIPIAPCGLPFEMTTPTGAVILAELVDEFGPMPAMQVSRIGYGAGQRDVPDRPNLLRILIGHALSLPEKSNGSDKSFGGGRSSGGSSSSPGGESSIQVRSKKSEDSASAPSDEAEDEHSGTSADFVWMIETNLDDLTGEEIGFAIERLWVLGALDVFTTSIGMKKNRPATMLSVMCRVSERNKFVSSVLEITGSLGVRVRKQERVILPRAQTEVDTPWGLVPGKVSMLPSGVVQFSPEYEDSRLIAIENGLRLKDVVEEIEACYRASEQLRRSEVLSDESLQASELDTEEPLRPAALPEDLFEENDEQDLRYDVDGLPHDSLSMGHADSAYRDVLASQSLGTTEYLDSLYSNSGLGTDDHEDKPDESLLDDSDFANAAFQQAAFEDREEWERQAASHFKERKHYSLESENVESFGEFGEQNLEHAQRLEQTADPEDGGQGRSRSTDGISDLSEASSTVSTSLDSHFPQLPTNSSSYLPPQQIPHQPLTATPETSPSEENEMFIDQDVWYRWDSAPWKRPTDQE